MTTHDDSTVIVFGTVVRAPKTQEITSGMVSNFPVETNMGKINIRIYNLHEQFAEEFLTVGRKVKAIGWLKETEATKLDILTTKTLEVIPEYAKQK